MTRYLILMLSAVAMSLAATPGTALAQRGPSFPNGLGSGRPPGPPQSGPNTAGVSPPPDGPPYRHSEG